jgi:hypothetical protein
MSGAEEILIDMRHQTELSLDSIVKKVECIKLETTNKSIIGKVSQILFTNNSIIVVDGESAMTINVFDVKGKFKYQIGQRGKGPGEYVEISNVSIEPRRNRIAVLDRMQNKVIYYAMNGDYDYSERTPFMLNYFEYLKNGFKAYYKYGMEDPRLGKFKYNPLIVTNPQNKIVYGDCDDLYEPNHFTYTMHRPLRKFSDEVYFSSNFSNTIYQVTDKMIVPKYHINIAWNAMPIINEQTTNKLFSEYCSRYIIFNGDIVELKDLSYINLMTPTGYPFVVYSHAKKKTFFSTDRGSHPLFPFIEGKAPLARYKDNAVVFDVSAYQLLMNKEKLYKSLSAKGLLDDLYNGLTENSNPVLIICHLNKDIE